MQLVNKSTRDYVCFDVVLKAGETVEVNNKTARDILMKQAGVEVAVSAKEIEAIRQNGTDEQKAKKRQN